MSLFEKLQLTVNMTVPVMETESVSGGTLTMRYLRALEAEGELEELERGCVSMLSLDLTQYSFCIVAKVVPMTQRILRKRKRSLEDQELFLKENLTTFLDTSNHVRKYWAFYNDPALDILELLIVFLRDEHAKPDALEEWKQSYLSYFREHYDVPHLPYEMFLGFGIGRFGTSRGRLRLRFKPPTREAAEKGILGRSEVLELEDSSLQSLAACHGESLVPDPAVLRSGEEADDGLTEAREAYARFEDIKGKSRRLSTRRRMRRCRGR
jgi:hypothetical protein